LFGTAMELGEFGIRVNAILPGIVEGGRISAPIRGEGEGARRRVRGTAETMTQSSKRVQPQQLANMIVFQAG
jgi:NAD(P)-dependent dehydrogenase (short-subunit alcohol dehydrogenase family)